MKSESMKNLLFQPLVLSDAVKFIIYLLFFG